VRISRRQTIKLFATAFFSGSLFARSAITHSAGPDSKEFISPLSALLGFLIDDEVNIQQQVLKKSLQKMQLDLVYEKTLLRGLSQLDQLSVNKWNKNFTALNAEQKSSLIRSLQNHNNPFLQRFYNTVNQTALEHYYSLPESWMQLGYDGPPQPAGFADYARQHTKPA